MPYTKYLSIEIENFKSFKNKQVFQLDRPSGLYFITGENKVDTELGANGAGKSSLLDSLSWCTDGKTVRGVVGNNIKHWGTKTASVTLNLETDSTPHSIKRTQSPNKLELDSTTVEQPKIDALRYIDHKKLLQSTIIGQFRESFLDLTPANRLKFFSSLMDLEIWEDCSKLAGTEAKKLEIKLASLEATKHSLAGQIELLKSQIVDLETKSKSHESERLTRLNFDKTLIEEERTAYDQLSSDEAELFKEKEAARTIADKVNSDLLESKSKISNIEKELRDLISQESALKSELRMANTEFDKWKSLPKESAECPYCNQAITKDTISAHKLEAIKSITSIKKNLDAVLSKSKELMESQRSILDIAINLEADYSNHKAIFNDTVTKLTELKSKKESSLKNIQRTQKEIDSIKLEINPYISLLDKTKSDLTTSENSATNAKSSIDLTNKDYIGYSYWSQGFRDLRLWMVNDALNSLSIEANNALISLGLVSHSFSYQIERETTTGSLSKGLHVLISSNATKESNVPIEAWSGGETQRLKIADTIGVASLIQGYTGYDSNIEFWDEPSSFLSEEGIDNLIDFLAARAESCNKTIYFIDQRALEKSKFKSVINIVKDENGSIIQE